LLKFGLVGSLTFLGLFIYFYKTSGKFNKSILAAFMSTSIFFSGVRSAGAVGKADGFTTHPQYQSRPRQRSRSGFFSGRSSSSGPGKPDGSGSGGDDSSSDGDGLPEFPQTESISETEERIERMDFYLREMSEVSDSETESEDSCRSKKIHPNAPHYSETVKFCDGYEARAVNSSLDHQVVKHGHDWGLDDIDLKTTKDANRASAGVKFKQIRTRLTPENRNQFRINLREFASCSNLKVYKSYPINKGMGRGYLEPVTNLFVSIDEDGIIRKTYPATKELITFLETNCDCETSETK
jgi:hypothetical protein